jgi:hypothetical protein
VRNQRKLFAQYVVKKNQSNMKKILTILALLLTVQLMAQPENQFVKKFTNFVRFENDKEVEKGPCFTLVTFNKPNKSDMILTINEKTFQLYSLKSPERITNIGDVPFQLIHCVDSDGFKVMIVYYDDDTFRMYFKEGTYIEFLNP